MGSTLTQRCRSLVWPGGLLAPALVFLVLGAGAFFTVGSVCTQVDGGATHCSQPPVQPWLVIVLSVLILTVSVAGPVLVAFKLLRQARRAVAFDPDHEFAAAH